MEHRLITCRGCNQDLPEQDFTPSRLASSNYICRPCGAAVLRDRHQQCRDLVRPLREVPCPGCGETVGELAMEWAWNADAPPELADRPMSKILVAGSVAKVEKALRHGVYMCRPCRVAEYNKRK